MRREFTRPGEVELADSIMPGLWLAAGVFLAVLLMVAVLAAILPRK